jgi:hypothetical protein
VFFGPPRLTIANLFVHEHYSSVFRSQATRRDRRKVFYGNILIVSGQIYTYYHHLATFDLKNSTPNRGHLGRAFPGRVSSSFSLWSLLFVKSVINERPAQILIVGMRQSTFCRTSSLCVIPPESQNQE